MTPDEDAFWQSILDTPYHDDRVRLVYADWLEDRGRLERADFIRVQCSLERLDDHDLGRPALLARQAELDPKILDNPTALFRYGFIERLYVRDGEGLASLLANPGFYFQYGPIRHLDVQAWHGQPIKGSQIQSLVGLPQMRWVPGLTLEYIDRDAALAVARSPQLNQVRMLKVSGDDWGESVWAALRQAFGDRLA